MLELFPKGFEEVEHADGVELVAYTDPGGEERLWHAFGSATAADVPDGWEESWRDFHRPIRVGNLWIGQPWQEVPEDAVAIVIDPGRAFGTGSHPTTRLCLELLGEVERGSFLDVGCGSGVLSIAAAKLGFSPVIAFDVDEEAAAAAQANAQANGVEIEVRQANAFTEELPSVDVAAANVTREAVERIGRRISCRAFVTSGYLVSEDVRIPGFQRERRLSADGWVADLHLRDSGEAGEPQ